MTSASAAAVSLYPASAEYTSTAVTGTPSSSTNRPGHGHPGSVVISRDSPGARAVQMWYSPPTAPSVIITVLPARPRSSTMSSRSSVKPRAGA